ncbi:glucose 1-dehydrogenase [Rhizomonospora bruguierae]|uniref:glucose 1-dehydrogenase n=1 Tax=Rhizomonospora bruguierae TaxID=1581705 RepID=UPI001BD17B70|nr:glucose 1-dehydrogenase [Micromonospora sp. NBRC 107566]
MRAVSVIPGQENSLYLDTNAPEPDPDEGPVLVEAIAVGICGTDREVIAGEYGEAPPGAKRLILGHESLGRVLEDPTRTFAPGDLVAGIVRHPDPVPCPNCAAGEWDMCRNGRFTEHGIKARHGFARDRWRVQPDHAIRLAPTLDAVGVLLEPTSVVAKAWEHIERIGERARWTPRTALVTGAGPIGLLAALLGVQRGLEVHVLDRATAGPKPALAARLGAVYHHRGVPDLDLEPDVALECTGAPTVVLDVMEKIGPNGIACLTGVSSGGRRIALDAGHLNRQLVLENNVIFGTVNANRRHWRQAADALLQADIRWLDDLITRRVPLDRYPDAYTSPGNDVKAVLEFG